MNTEVRIQDSVVSTIYDGNQVVADVDSSGSLIRSYTYGPGIDNILAMTVYTGTVEKTYYYITDHLGTVHALTDSSGNIVESYKYDAWGKVLEIKDGNGTVHISSFNFPTSPLGNRYLWQGREYSYVTGLYNFRARYYDPITGRWLSKDPIGISGGLNQYVFVENNPVNYGDPLGLQSMQGGSGDVYRPDLTGHGVNPQTGKPLDPHVDRILRGGKKYRYNPNGTPRGNAPGVPKRDMRAFTKALSKLGIMMSRFQLLIIVMPPNYHDTYNHHPERPVTLPYIPGSPVPEGYDVSPFNQKKGPCGDEPTEYIRSDRWTYQNKKESACYV